MATSVNIQRKHSFSWDFIHGTLLLAFFILKGSSFFMFLHSRQSGWMILSVFVRFFPIFAF